ncbi:hypothetical protein I6E50_10235 [Roseburia hominis]|uniref:MATE family efflux transporter n=1 Tax=Roseburia hominis TaxID=301301 RepID=UPI001EFF374A|nr:hypothetical protein [Roseburia hominis]
MDKNQEIFETAPIPKAVASVVIGGVLTAALLFIREPVIRLFMNDDIIVEYGAKMFGILQISCPVIGLMFLGINTLQAFGKGLTSLILSVCRQGLVYIPVHFVNIQMDIKTKLARKHQWKK